MQVQELVSASQKSGVAMFVELSSTFTDSLDRLAHLNLEAARNFLNATRNFSQQALSAQGPSEWLAVQSEFMAPASQQVQDYNRRVLELAAAAQAACVRCTQAQVAEYGTQTRAVLNDLAQRAPRGSEPIVAALDSAISAAHALYGSLQETGQQAVEAARSSLEMATAAASKSAKRAVDLTAETAKR